MQEEQEDIKGKEGRQKESVSVIVQFLLLYYFVKDLFFKYFGSISVNLFFNGFFIIFYVCGNRADPFAKKDWYDIKAPSVFNERNIGKTLVTRTQGTKVSSFFL